MATVQQVIQVVLGFAQTNIFTSSPDTIDDAIVPKPANMNDLVFNDYFAALSGAVAAGGIQANVPVQCTKDCLSWMDVVNCVFFNQVGGGLG